MGGTAQWRDYCIFICISTGSSITCDFEDPYLCGYYSTDANTEMEGKHVIYQDWIYDHTYGNISGECMHD